MQELIIVIPAYNEGVTVGRIIGALRVHVPNCEVVVVDDGSVDNTAEAAAQAGATVLSLPFNCGYGVALQTGLLYARRNGASYVVTMDADGQHEVSDVLKLVVPLQNGEADVTLGSRYLPGSKTYRVPLSRRYASWFLSKVLSCLVGCSINDTTTGFQGLNLKALRIYLGMRDFPESTPDADLLFYAYSRGCRLLEIPVTMHEDTTGDSMHGILKSMFYIPKMFVSLLSIVLGYQFLKRKGAHSHS